MANATHDMLAIPSSSRTIDRAEKSSETCFRLKRQNCTCHRQLPAKPNDSSIRAIPMELRELYLPICSIADGL